MRSIRNGKKAEDFNFADGMNDDEKKKFRAKLIQHAKASGRSISRIFTLPGREGFCAQEFRREWPEAEIIGVERKWDIVRNSSLKATRILDEFYATELREFVRSDRARANDPVLKRGLYQLVSKSISLEPFDLSYIDLCGWSRTYISDVVLFIKRFAVPGSIVAATFTYEYNANPEDQQRRDTVECLRGEFNIEPIVETYTNRVLDTDAFVVLVTL